MITQTEFLASIKDSTGTPATFVTPCFIKMSDIASSPNTLYFGNISVFSTTGVANTIQFGIDTSTTFQVAVPAIGVNHVEEVLFQYCFPTAPGGGVWTGVEGYFNGYKVVWM
jgi:hypothetical protein